MWIAVVFALLALMEASAFSIGNRQISRRGPRIVRNTIRKVDRSSRPFSKRQDGVVDTSVYNDVYRYYLNMSIGTPEQTFRVVIDTGSSDLWVNVYGNACNTINSCGEFGSYNGNASTTYSFAGSGFNITYGDGSSATGDYATDIVSFGDIALQQQKFGVSYDSSDNFVGIMGIGYQLNEAIVAFDDTSVYDNIPLSLLSQGHISSLLYSIWLNDLSSSEGELLFGGINRAKYQGRLTTLPVIPYDNDRNPALDGRFVRLQVALGSVTLGGQSYPGNDTVVLLDTGSSFSHLPNTITDGLFASLNVTLYNDGQYYVDCDLARSTDNIDFAFGSVTISVPFDELVIPVEDSSEICLFGIEPTTSRYILGDTFLRSAYVVYDLHNNEISLAQTIFDSTLDDIVEVVDNESVRNIDSDGTGTTTSTSATASTSTRSSAIFQSSTSVVSSPTTLSISATSSLPKTSSTLAAPSMSSSSLSSLTSTPCSSTAVSTSIAPLPITTPVSTEFCSRSTTASLSSSSVFAPYPTGNASCPVDGVLLCGPTPEYFGLCNFGQVIWQRVSDGTNCIDGEIVGTGIYGVPEPTAA